MTDLPGKIARLTSRADIAEGTAWNGVCPSCGHQADEHEGRLCMVDQCRCADLPWTVGVWIEAVFDADGRTSHAALWIDGDEYALPVGVTALDLERAIIAAPHVSYLKESERIVGGWRTVPAWEEVGRICLLPLVWR